MEKKFSDKRILKEARRVIDIEIENIIGVRKCLGSEFVRAIRMLACCNGKVIVTGIGKSGIIGRKISATLASTGTPSTFLHPGEAIHGDLGMVCKSDIVLAISNSGETEEIVRIIPSLKKIGAPIISITSEPKSSLGLQSTVVLCTGSIKEADPFSLIPTSSTTAALVLGDALAITLLSIKGFQKEDYAFYHPGGNLGRRLMLRVKDVMQTGSKIPVVNWNSSMDNVLMEINKKNLGFTLVVDDNQKVIGIITDGDLRRLLVKKKDIFGMKAFQCMTHNPLGIEEDKLAVQALAIMEEKEITCLVIRDKNNRARGIVHLHDLLGKRQFSQEI
ncbi:MAG: KpsF/GutQ family sugar-phosphate isomerase [Candidatus Omnitrophica bacterium]|nr:KpsF/GutQ family sugar-phosphate isomerase [Candidatus Omnitrophota bacterium]MCM8817733.1 KpsF/GutQ family sugar-phosphate isomerase [Candidatus Omnitrophota bacterium]